MKVRIKKLPQARTGYQVQGSLANDVPAMGGADYNTYIGSPKLKSSKYITRVARNKANLEAEGGETAYGDLNGDGMAEHKIIKGPRHSNGGVPLNLPDDTFIYSDFRGMNIKEPELLSMFGKKSKGKKSYTPAELAKQYDIEKYRKILQDPNSDKIDIKTAELMIKNYQNKLAALALVQEAKKGFPQGIAKASEPFMADNKYDENTFMSPEIKQFADQMTAQTETDNSNTELQDEEQVAEAQDMNQGQPVAQPQQMSPEMQQPMAQYGMSMGGFDYPYEDMPEAEYGMAMGANPNNYMGRTKSPMYARGGALEKYTDKGAVTAKGPRVDVTGKSPAEVRRMRWDAKEDAKKKKITFVEPEFYRKDDKGKEINVKYKGAGQGAVPKTLEEIAKVNRAQEALLEKQLKEPGVAEALFEETKSALTNNKHYKNRKGVVNEVNFNKYSKLAQTLTKEQAVKLYMDQIKRGNQMKEKGFDSRMFNNSGSKLLSAQELVANGVAATPDEAKKLLADYNAKKWTTLQRATKEMGITEPDDNTVALEQATSRGYIGLYKGLQNGKYTDPNIAYNITNFVGDPDDDKDGKGRFNLNTGAADEYSELGKEYAEISPIDGWRGNTTAGHGSGGNLTEGELEDVIEPEEKDKVKEKKPCPCKKSDGTEIDTGTDSNGECLPCEEEVPVDVPKEPAQFWLQDNLKTAGAFANLMSIKKAMPYEPRFNFVKPSPRFQDPTRAIAANAEQAQIQSNALAQFVGPQSLSSRLSGVQGQMSKNAADITANIGNINSNIANQYESNLANIQNQENQLNTGAMSRLYDKNTIANQNFQNSLRQGRSELLAQYTNAITNKYKTDAMNQLYPQYKVTPGNGGELVFNKGKLNKPDAARSVNEYIQECKDAGLVDENAIMKCVREKKSGVSSDDGSAAVLAQYSNQGNQQLQHQKHGGFIYSDITFPFVL